MKRPQYLGNNEQTAAITAVNGFNGEVNTKIVKSTQPVFQMVNEIKKQCYFNY